MSSQKLGYRLKGKVVSKAMKYLWGGQGVRPIPLTLPGNRLRTTEIEVHCIAVRLSIAGCLQYRLGVVPTELYVGYKIFHHYLQCHPQISSTLTITKGEREGRDIIVMRPSDETKLTNCLMGVTPSPFLNDGHYLESISNIGFKHRVHGLYNSVTLKNHLNN